MNTDTNPFGDGDAIFAWKKPLKKDSFNPDEIFCRDEEIALYTNALQDIPNGHDPNNVFIYGPTGVGKTAVTRWMREKLREQVEQTDVKLTITDPINCRHYDTNFQLLTAILNELRPEKKNIDTNGLGTNRVFNMVFEEIEEIGGNIVIILDEIDNIPPDARNDFLYDIPRAEANGRIENASIRSNRRSNRRWVNERSSLARTMRRNSRRSSVTMPIWRSKTASWTMTSYRSQQPLLDKNAATCGRGFGSSKRRVNTRVCRKTRRSEKNTFGERTMI
jgi:hypothetical protein